MDQSNNECEASELASESARRELGSSGSIDGNGNDDDDDDDESKNVNSDLRYVYVFELMCLKKSISPHLQILP